MATRTNRLILHSSVAYDGNLMQDIDISKSIGFDGIDPSARKLRGFLNAGYTYDELRDLTRGVDIPGFGAVFDTEREGAGEVELMKEAEEIFELALTVGAKGIQVLTGPVDVQAVRDHKTGVSPTVYAGMLGRPRIEQLEVTTRNLAKLADRAAEVRLQLYIEPLSWTPLNRVADHVDIIERAGRDNLKLLVDFWHCFTAGDTPDDVAKLDKRLIYGIHICDSLPFDGGIPDENVLRNVELGAGVIDLKLWTDAVKATGYDDWWGCESLSLRLRQQNGYRIANDVFALMHRLVFGEAIPGPMLALG
jgi:sugar phosphate isomerase/epimerase